MVSQLISGSSNLDALPAITLLRKLCNHPHLIIDDLEKWQHLEIDSQLLTTTAESLAISKFSGGIAILMSGNYQGRWVNVKLS